ncbi:MAG: hypothetical protein U1E05_18620 [Patescibacteria group bacterium]|nr:hypothetical protein [Patescibacteria group bacterium]
MYSNRLVWRATGSVLLALLFYGNAARASEQEPLTAGGKPTEGPLEAFLGEPLLEKQVVFEGDSGVREPYLAVAVDGTVLAMRNYDKLLRRSEDGG